MNRVFKRSAFALMAWTLMIMMGLSACAAGPNPDQEAMARASMQAADDQAASEAELPTQTLSQVAAPREQPTDSLPEKVIDQSAELRVMLKSLDNPVALGLTLQGSYTVDGDKGFRFDQGTELKVAVDGKNLLLSCGGMTIDMGTSFALKRHATDDERTNGLFIHENKYDTLYLGDLRLISDDGGIVPVLTIDVDDYLMGVVPFEMSDSFPIEALKAQAVAARTYALARRAANAQRAYDVVDTTADQVFRGLNPDYENAIKAVEQTRYVAGIYKGNYATCYFGASNGGQTALPDQIWGYPGDYGYLDMRDDPYDLENESSVVKRLVVSKKPGALDAGIRKRLKREIDRLAAENIEFTGIESIQPIEPKHEGGCRMYTKLRVALAVDTGGDELAEKPVVDLDFYGDLKPNFGLKINSANIEMASVTEAEDAFVIESRRFGHGVGMSQRGAQQMAGKHGMSWLQIMEFYYPGMDLMRMGFKNDALTKIDALPASLGYARPKPTAKPTPAPLRALKNGERYAVVKVETKAGTLNVREQTNTDSKILGLLNSGQRVIVVKVTDTPGWAEIETSELKGFVSMDYLVTES